MNDSSYCPVTFKIVEVLKRICGEAFVYFDDDRRIKKYSRDKIPKQYGHMPEVVVLPKTAQEIAQVVKLANLEMIPITPRAAGSGLSGGAVPIYGGILLSIERMNNIFEVDDQNLMAVVEPGVVTSEINERLRPEGLFYAGYPMSLETCYIGGNVAENAGGVHCLKYGLTTHNIARLEVVTIDGERLSIGSSALDSPGYDLLALMTGSEGLLGVIVEVTVRLLPVPERAQVVLAAFDSVETAGEAIAGIISAGILPAGLEMMDNLAIRAAEDFVHAGYPVDAAAIVLCELDGTNEEVSEQIMQVRALMTQCGATEVRTARDEQERQRLTTSFQAMESLMGQMNSTSAWLTQQTNNFSSLKR